MKYIIIILSVTLFCYKDRKHTHTVSTSRDTGYALYVNPLPSVAGSNKLNNLADSFRKYSYYGGTDTFVIVDAINKRGVGRKIKKAKGYWTYEGGNSFAGISKVGTFFTYDTNKPAVYSNLAKIVDSGDVIIKKDTSRASFYEYSMRVITNLSANYVERYKFNIATLRDTGKVEYWHVIIADSAGEIAYLKNPNDNWVIKDSARTIRCLLKYLKDEADLLQKYRIQYIPKKDSLAYPYNVR